MLYDFTIIGEAEDVDARPVAITGPVLKAVQHNVIALDDHATEFNALARIVPRGFLEVVDEAPLAVATPGLC